MLKRFALMFTATAMLAIPASSAFAVPEAGAADQGLLPPEACFAVFPQTANPLLCGYGNGAPDKSGT